MKMPNAWLPGVNRQITGARVTFFAATCETISRRVTERFLRSPITASAYPFLRFSASFLFASARALS